MKDVDCLLVHVPKFNNRYKPFGDYLYIKSIPIGLFAIGDFLERKGLSTEILHLGITATFDHDFDLIEYIRESNIKVVGFSLHWHHQSYDVIEVARRVKQNLPKVLVLLGGISASFFADEIIENYSFIDAVIMGDGEVPLQHYVNQALKDKQDFSEVPNLVWRNEGRCVQNKVSYAAKESELNELNFTNFSLLRNHEIYIGIFGRSSSAYLKDASIELNTRRRVSPIVPLGIGRGCSVNCIWCGGAKNAHASLFGRNISVFRSQERIIDDIKKANQYGVSSFSVAFYAHPTEDKYYTELFSKIRESKLDIDMYFECSTLPTKLLIDGFSATFGGRSESILCLSRLTANEKVRAKNLGYYYSNNDLIDTLKFIQQKGIPLELTFTIGMPGENVADVKGLVAFRNKILKKYSCVRSGYVFLSQIEPASLWYQRPENYNIKTNLRSFKDYYDFHSSRTTSSYTHLGYVLKDFFNNRLEDNNFEKRINRLRCLKFCLLAGKRKWYRPHFLGNIKCELLNIFWRMKGLFLNRKNKNKIGVIRGD